ncbi:MAG TPA: GntR family transcriptional regulator, partial [Micromonosporaceae bacterium]|nr:GntR family transcriptional regulator [Micromonosporaceae bacterium]
MPTMYVRIADDLARQIAAGDLSPGDRVPSTRQIAAQRGVAMATATKALAELQRRGLVRSVVGVGTVVADAAGEEALALPTASLGARTPMASSPRRTATVGEPTITGRSSPALTRAADMQGRIVEAAIRLADSEGIGAVSMRRIGIELGVPTMSLYRWVPSKDDLTLYMLDATLGTMTWPDPPPPGWRAQLEYAARGQWAVTRAHPWLAQLLS